MDQIGSLREEFAKCSGDFEYLCGLFCRVLEENEAGDVDVHSRVIVCRRGDSTRPSLSVTTIPLCCARAVVASDGAQGSNGSTDATVGVQKDSTAKPKPGMGSRAPCAVGSPMFRR